MRISELPGVGEKKTRLFHKLGLFCCQDLLAFFPRDYEDRTRVFTASVCQPVIHRLIRKGLSVSKTVVSDGQTDLRLTFFNMPYVRQALREGQTYVFFGAVADGGMTNPVFEPLEKAGQLTGRIMPVYRLTAGLTQNAVRGAVAQALRLSVLHDPLPPELRARYELCGLSDALHWVHQPPDWPSLTAAKRRLAFEELFILFLALGRVKETRTRREGPVFSPFDRQVFAEALPFTLTGAQQRVMDEIARDFASGGVSCRLIQGDVGSGKTMVAAYGAVCAAHAGFQTALMAPTELLAVQHAKTLTPLLASLGVSAALLTGKTPTAQRRDLCARLREGSLSVCIGTHALLSEDVPFHRLGLAITDEQHRFGVAQRAALQAKGVAHTLVMSATPIPRTLALLIYGDMEVSVIDELPPGRLPVKTYVVDSSYRARIEAFIDKTVAEGGQVYVVCPAIEEGDDGRKAVQTYDLDKRLPHLRIARLHGQRRSEDKADIMRRYAEGEIDVLVATTVVEVGVDVPRATLMVVENAEFFGLSQLHQLRGRVGRGHQQAHCILFLGSAQPDSVRRLAVLKDTNDGFALAQADLELRGPGDFFGRRQHGLPTLHAAPLAADTDVLSQAQQAAQAFLPRLADYAPLVARTQDLLKRLENL